MFLKCVEIISLLQEAKFITSDKMVYHNVIEMVNNVKHVFNDFHDIQQLNKAFLRTNTRKFYKKYFLRNNANPNKE